MTEAIGYSHSATIERSLDQKLGWLKQSEFVSSDTLRGAIAERLKTLPSYVPHTGDEAFFDILRNLVRKGLRGTPRCMAIQWDAMNGSGLRDRVEIAIEYADDKIRARKLRKRIRI